MDQKKFECLDCHVIFPFIENHTCQKNNNGLFVSKLGAENNHIVGLHSPTIIYPKHTTSEDIKCNWVHPQNEMQGAYVMVEDTSRKERNETKFFYTATSEHRLAFNFYSGAISEESLPFNFYSDENSGLPCCDSRDDSSTVDREVQKEKFTERSVSQDDKKSHSSFKVVSRVKQMKRHKTVDYDHPFASLIETRAVTGPSVIDVDSHWCPKKRHFACTTCGKEIRYKCHFIIHLRTHSGEKPFSCEICVKGFKRKYDLTTHFRTHTEKKSFCCDKCGKRFAKNKYLTRHLFTHIGEKPFVCHVCKSRFTQKKNLIKHLNTHSEDKS